MPRYLEVVSALNNVNALLLFSMMIVFFDLPELVLDALKNSLHGPSGTMATAFVFSIGCASPKQLLAALL